MQIYTQGISGVEFENTKGAACPFSQCHGLESIGIPMGGYPRLRRYGVGRSAIRESKREAIAASFAARTLTLSLNPRFEVYRPCQRDAPKILLPEHFLFALARIATCGLKRQRSRQTPRGKVPRPIIEGGIGFMDWFACSSLSWWLCPIIIAQACHCAI